MKTKIPPPVILLTFGIAMWLVARQATSYLFSVPYPLILSCVIAALGFACAAAGVVEFYKANTTVNPHRIRKASALVTSGIFRFTRNPMYVGLLLVLVGWFLWLGTVVNAVLLFLFVVAITELQIKPEEHALAELFGDDYRQYCSRVRRWV